jgi:hypothetical protein
MSLATHRSRGIGELVDATFNLYRAHFLTVVTVALLVVAPPAIAKVLAPAAFERLLDFVGNLLIPIGQGAIASIVAASVEREQALSSGDALRSTGGRTGSLIGVQIVSGLMVFFGFVLLVVPGLIALAWTAVGVPVVMIEEVGYAGAIKRSRALARGKWKHVFGTLLLSWGLAILLLLGAGVIMGMAGVGDRVTGFLGELLFAVVLPVPAIAMTLLYYDLRVRTESADLDAMISALPASMPAAEPTA